MVFFRPKFNRILGGWYLSHSESPNAQWRAEDQMYSRRNIRAGEELTILIL